MLVEGNYLVKDLRIIADRDLKDIIIVDNSILSFAFQMDNGIPINAFFTHMSDDQELLYLITFLEEVYHANDCREMNRKNFKLKELQEKLIS
jgi:CTD small phosphatase-like protein 2